jgi:hypothetical protein
MASGQPIPALDTLDDDQLIALQQQLQQALRARNVRVSPGVRPVLGGAVRMQQVRQSRPTTGAPHRRRGAPMIETYNHFNNVCVKIDMALDKHLTFPGANGPVRKTLSEAIPIDQADFQALLDKLEACVVHNRDPANDMQPFVSLIHSDPRTGKLACILLIVLKAWSLGLSVAMFIHTPATLPVVKQYEDIVAHLTHLGIDIKRDISDCRVIDARNDRDAMRNLFTRPDIPTLMVANMDFYRTMNVSMMQREGAHYGKWLIINDESQRFFVKATENNMMSILQVRIFLAYAFLHDDVLFIHVLCCADSVRGLRVGDAIGVAIHMQARSLHDQY